MSRTFILLAFFVVCYTIFNISISFIENNKIKRYEICMKHEKDTIKCDK